MEGLYISTLIILSLAVLAAIISHWLKISVALVEITIGIVGGYVIKAFYPEYVVDVTSSWFAMLASIGALMLTFLAGSELDASVLKQSWKTAGLIGIAAFLLPFLGCAAAAYYLFSWTAQASWLTGLVLSTTSVAVVYSTLLELGINETEYGKSLLTTCFVTDLCTVLAMGFIFSPFSLNTIIFFIVTIIFCALLPVLGKKSFKTFGNKPSAFEMKFILFFLVLLGLAAIKVSYEPVLPAFFVGIVLSGVVGKNHQLVKHLQTITFGFLTPFYFVRAGFLVSVPTLIFSALPIFAFLLLKIFFKGLGIYLSGNLVNCYKKEMSYTVLLMSTGLAFGSIAAMFGLTHQIIDKQTYSLLIAVVVSSAIIPTIIANAFFSPRSSLLNKAIIK